MIDVGVVVGRYSGMWKCPGRKDSFHFCTKTTLGDRSFFLSVPAPLLKCTMLRIDNASFPTADITSTKCIFSQCIYNIFLNLKMRGTTDHETNICLGITTSLRPRKMFDYLPSCQHHKLEGVKKIFRLLKYKIYKKTKNGNVVKIPKQRKQKQRKQIISFPMKKQRAKCQGN